MSSSVMRGHLIEYLLRAARTAMPWDCEALRSQPCSPSPSAYQTLATQSPSAYLRAEQFLQSPLTPKSPSPSRLSLLVSIDWFLVIKNSVVASLCSGWASQSHGMAARGTLRRCPIKCRNGSRTAEPLISLLSNQTRLICSTTWYPSSTATVMPPCST